MVQSGSGTNTINAPLTLGGSQSWTNNSSNLLTIGGTVTNGGNLLTVAGSGQTTISGAINGSGGLTLNGLGATLTLSGANTYGGADHRHRRHVAVRHSGGLGNGTNNTSGVSVASGAALVLDGLTPTADVTLGLTGQFSSTVGTLTNSNAAAASYGGVVTLNAAASLGGNFGGITLAGGLGTSSATLTKVGSDTLTLDGTNGAFTGNVLVSSGAAVPGRCLGAGLQQRGERGQRRHAGPEQQFGDDRRSQRCRGRRRHGDQ